MSDQVWIRVTAADNIPEREGRAVRIGAREIAIFNLGDRFLATDNRCPHHGGPLCDGIVTGRSVVCPLHAWKVSLESGSVERPVTAKDHCVATYSIRVEDGVIVIQVPVTAAGSADPPPSPEGYDGRVVPASAEASVGRRSLGEGGRSANGEAAA